jgi:hypothetical protein
VEKQWSLTINFFIYTYTILTYTKYDDKYFFFC